MSNNRYVLRVVQRSAWAIMAVLVLASSTACAKLGEVKAMMNFKEANQAYQKQDYKKAAELYEITVQSDPSLASVYFFLGNSYDNMWKPGVNTPANDELLNKAVENYQIAAEKIDASDPANA